MKVKHALAVERRRAHYVRGVNNEHRIAGAR